jgi:hypothetical protein
LAKAIPFPKNDVLFVNHKVYDFLIDEEISISAYYADPTYDVRDIFKKILSNPNANYNTTISNYKFYSKSIKPLETFSLDIDELINIDGYNNSSPGITKIDGGYLVNVRHVSYSINKNTGAYLDKNTGKNCKHVNTLNSHLLLDENFDYVSHKTFNTLGISTNHVNGIEDIRLINTTDGLLFTGNVWQDYGKIKVVTGEYETHKDNLDFIILDSPFTKDCEKNWSPFIHNGELKFVYDWNPIMIGTINKNALQITKTDLKQLSNFRGGSPGIVIGNEIWFLTHCVEYSTPRRYYHSFVILDAETLEYVNHSKLFTFEGENIEFAVGMEHIIDQQGNDKLIITHSVWDAEAYLKTYNLDTLIKNLF